MTHIHMRNELHCLCSMYSHMDVSLLPCLTWSKDSVNHFAYGCESCHVTTVSFISHMDVSLLHVCLCSKEQRVSHSLNERMKSSVDYLIHWMRDCQTSHSLNERLKSSVDYLRLKSGVDYLIHWMREWMRDCLCFMYQSILCDMTHLNVTWLTPMWHDSLMCNMTQSNVTWLIHMRNDPDHPYFMYHSVLCDVTHPYHSSIRDMIHDSHI